MSPASLVALRAALAVACPALADLPDADLVDLALAFGRVPVGSSPDAFADDLADWLSR